MGTNDKRGVPRGEIPARLPFPLLPLLPSPFPLSVPFVYARDRVVSRACVLLPVVPCQPCAAPYITVPYRVVTYRGMPSKKKKYNARFPAVSRIALPPPISVRSRPEPRYARRRHEARGEKGAGECAENPESTRRRVASPPSLASATKKRASECRGRRSDAFA